MKDFYGEEYLLESETAKKIYHEIKDLPIIDYHCHLDETAIKEDKKFENIGELWLSGDHYKWHAMRLCGVDEKYITGEASYKEKFLKFAEIFPMLCGNSVYMWAQMELKQLLILANDHKTCACLDTSGGRAVRSGRRRFGPPRAIALGRRDRHTNKLNN